MSEQTPDTESGMTDAQDPSMEDILASIRKIIAEDDIETPAAPESVIAEVVPDVSGDVSKLGHVDTLDLDIITDEAPAVDTDIEALLGDMDVTVSDDITPSVTPVESSEDASLEDILDLEIPLDQTEAVAEVEMPDSAAEIDLIETETLTLEDELIDLVEDPAPDTVEAVTEDAPKATFMDGAMAALGLGGAAAIGKAAADVPEVNINEEDDLSLMLDNMLEDSESYEEDAMGLTEDRVIDPAADLIAEDEGSEDLLAELDFVEEAPESADVISQSDPDIDLVKSLMADLTEEPLHDEVEATLDTPDMSDELDTSADDIMDEILSVTIDDETKLSEELSIPEITTPPIEDAPAEGLSLKEIAAAAEADAQATESGGAAGLVAGLGAAAIAGAALAQDEAVEIEDSDIEAVDIEAIDIQNSDIEDAAVEILEDNIDDVDAALSNLEDLLADDEATEQNDLTPETITPEPPIEETPEMPRAKKSDAIIDEVTESATAGAFASLNQVVEEKATVAERGDRIGDIVMEALQPMLKEWLDANLKGIVERAVTKEVKRISSGK